jgi:membrane protease subunit (stomatin/prohibitin family)
MLNFLPLGGLEAKWIIAGVVATGAAVAIGSKDKGTSSSLQSQQASQAQAQAAAEAAKNTCPVVASCNK